LAALGGCATGADSTGQENRKMVQQPSLTDRIDMPATMQGEAADTKAGAVLALDDESLIYIDGLDYWPDDVRGKRLEVSGVLRRKQAIPPAGAPGDALIRQGAGGDQFVLEDARWSVLE
jgi:hypothetical protein